MFEHINSILYKSKAKELGADSEFQPFLVQRWCSMHSAPLTTIINETSNKYWSILEDNTMWYTMLTTSLPKCNFKRIEYIKKSKKEEQSISKNALQKVANNLEISSRELKYYVDNFNIDLSHIIKNEKQNKQN